MIYAFIYLAAWILILLLICYILHIPVEFAS
jgi:hypothetical protein